MTPTSYGLLVTLVFGLAGPGALAQANWTRQSPLPYPPQLAAKQIAFSGSRGYIVGSNRHLLETTDGGSTWHERVLSGPTLNDGGYYAVSFVGPYGWIVGDNLTWANSCFRTIDDGVTWTQMHIALGAQWSHVDFVSPTRGWAGAWGALFTTFDGGSSWTQQNFGVVDRIDTMNFRDANVGLLSSQGALRRTQNGGASWTVVHGHDALAIEWLDASVVIASTLSSGGPDFARSTDAGLTWQTIEVPGVALQAPVRVDATTLIAGTDDADLYRSTDAGLTWTKVWDGMQACSTNGGVFTSNTDGFMIGSGNLIYRTNDGGQSWSYASNGFGMEFEDLKMFNAQRGLVAGGGGTIMRTENGGATWIPTRPGWTQSNGYNLMDLSIVAPSFAFAAGNHGTLVKTLDGGATWQGVPAPTGYPNGGTGDYWACAFISPTEGWIAGSYLEITHTTDGGATWQQQYVGGSSADGAYDMDFVDAQHGWIVGAFDGVFRTTNGGANWQLITFPSPGPHARAVDFVNPQVGWAAGRDGWIARSTNGGVTWTPQMVPGVTFGTNLFSIHALTTEECWAASNDDGRVFRTTNGGSTWVEITTPFHDDYDGYTGIAAVPGGEIWVAGPHGVVSHFGVSNTPTTSLCVGDGSGTACPCGNHGVSGRGCANSSIAGGALLVAGGVASATTALDTWRLEASSVPNGPGMYVQFGSLIAGSAGVAFGDGLLCGPGPIVRLGLVAAAQGSSTFPSGATPPSNLPISIGGANTAGDVRAYQLWYRDAAAFCTSATFNLTNAIRVAWTP
jgi:photosystem II stability/assembly factor-like uncharacterized protein